MRNYVINSPPPHILTTNYILRIKESLTTNVKLSLKFNMEIFIANAYSPQKCFFHIKLSP